MRVIEQPFTIHPPTITRSNAPRPRNMRNQRRRNSRANSGVSREDQIIAIAPRAPCPFPPTLTVELPYADNDLRDTGVGGAMGTDWAFRLNSLYDPDHSYVGHQPYGFDQLCASGGPYNYFRVHRIKMEVTFTDPSADGLFWAVNVGTQALNGQNLSFARESPFCATGMINNTGSQVARFSQTANVWDIMSVPKHVYETSDDYKGSYNSDPAHYGLMRANVGLVDSSIMTAQSCNVVVKLIYFATFYSRAGLGQS